MSLISLEGALSRLQNKRVPEKQSAEAPQQPVATVFGQGDNRFEISPKAAQAHKVLTFAGSRGKVSTGVQLESRFIETLRNSQDADEKAGVAEMLGRAHSLNAIPSLKKLLSLEESVDVRSAVIQALGQIGDSTHQNSFTRGDVDRELVNVYKSRKALLASRSRMKDETSPPPLNPEERDAIKTELNVLAQAIGRLNVGAGRDLLVEDFKATFVQTEQSLRSAQEMMKVMRMVETELHRSLEERFQKPIKEILQDDLNPMALAQIKAKTQVQFPDGSKMSLGEVGARIQQFQYQHRFNTGLMLGLIDGLSQKPNRQVVNALSVGLKSTHPGIKAKTLEVLGQHNVLNYSSDILPNLSSKSTPVRQAALGALLQSEDSTAKQKVIEFLDPVAFTKLHGQEMLSPKSLASYREFAGQVAENGDRFAGLLSKIAVNSDYDLVTRQMSLLPLSMMVQKPLRDELAPKTVKRAGDIIRSLATNPAGMDSQEKETLALLATRLWVGMKEPQAVAEALNWIDGRYGRVDEKAQTQLLLALSKAAQESYNETELNEKRDPDSFSRLVLDVLENTQPENISAETLQSLRKSLKPGELENLLEPQTDKQLYSVQSRVLADEIFIKTLEDQFAKLRPTLHRQLEHRSSVENRLLAALLLGLFKDRGSVDALIQKTRDPLKGLLNWNKPTSFRGDPSRYGLSLRQQSIQSLGRIGDSKAVDVMLDALDDPGLKAQTLPALAQLGPDANNKLSWQKLKQVRDKLSHVMSDPSTTRLTRAVRIDAANTLYQFKGGADVLKEYIAATDNPNFKRHALAGLIKNGHGLDPGHADHDLVKGQIYPGLGVEKLHAKGLTGKGVEMAIIDGGYVDGANKEAFQNRVKLPAEFVTPEHYHPTMVMSTAAGNGKLKGVAPDATVYSDKWPELGGPQPMEVYKKLIEGKLRGENNVRVINNSWGFSDNGVIVYQDIRNILKEFKKVVDLAEKAGILFTFAAGNEGEDQGIPSLGTLTLFGIDVDKLATDSRKDLDYILDKVVVVGAINTQDSSDYKDFRLAEFSSVGDSLNSKLKPTVLAPGVDMMVYSWENGHKPPMELVNGTSFADPFVTGLAALMFQKNPDLTPAQARTILKTTAIKLPNLPDSFQGYGVVDPQAAVAKAQGYGKPVRGRQPAEQPAELPATPAVSEDVATA